MQKNSLTKNVIAKLKTIPDPEFNISLWDLGLIYDVTEKNGNVKILMTLTSPGCPLFYVIEGNIKNEIQKIKGVKEVKIKLTFEPPWSFEKMSKKARLKLGF